MIALKNVSVVLGGQLILDDINLEINKGDVVAITGSSGSGKTSLAKVLTGNLFHSGTVTYTGFPGNTSVGFVAQEHQFKNLSNTTEFYYQQRFNSSDSDLSLKVSDLLKPDNHWIDALKLREVFERPLLQLSNGENKRLQLAQKLEEKPDVLILDNPFLGLDVAGRKILEEVIAFLVSEGVQIILLTVSSALPHFITHVIALDHGKLVFEGTREQFLDDTLVSKQTGNIFDFSLLRSLASSNNVSFEFAVRMESVHIQYGEKTVLDNITWNVRRGECWSLSGPNGAGKSTLLSLITADNPQAYANEIFLFDRKRGTGESIWDIKKNIGFVSPELHLYFDQGSVCSEVIGSGLFDTIGLFRVLNEDQRSLVDKWISILALDSCRHKPLRSMSRGEQRLALLGRALIKMPPLLVLDEPCQGLDEFQTASFASLINSVCREFGTTLIYVSHFVHEIPDCVTFFLRLEDGRSVT